mmetsp:Transcript_3986/g.13294  ORF Transcript_3986/g.13294 Transcript_3986/m.13294 type:complete len:214 (-) Transcript_3986:853-1494(-)
MIHRTLCTLFPPWSVRPGKPGRVPLRCGVASARWSRERKPEGYCSRCDGPLICCDGEAATGNPRLVWPTQKRKAGHRAGKEAATEAPGLCSTASRGVKTQGAPTTTHTNGVSGGAALRYLRLLRGTRARRRGRRRRRVHRNPPPPCFFTAWESACPRTSGPSGTCYAPSPTEQSCWCASPKFQSGSGFRYPRRMTWWTRLSGFAKNTSSGRRV